MTTELPKSILTKRQKSERVKIYTEDGRDYKITAEIRYDDECGNGHNSFAITGQIQEKGKHGGWLKEPFTCGCIHEDIIKHFPELEKYIKWHLTSSDSPMHYVANTIYHASNRDYNGCLKGEPRVFERMLIINESPFPYKPDKRLFAFIDEVGLDANWADFEIIEVPYVKKRGESYDFKPKHSLALMPVVEWYQAPFDTWEDACNFIHAMSKCKVEIVKRATAYGEGKERDFDGARHCGVWPDATDEQLSLPKEELEKLLLARLPAMMLEFKNDMEELGFVY